MVITLPPDMELLNELNQIVAPRKKDSGIDGILYKIH